MPCLHWPQVEKCLDLPKTKYKETTKSHRSTGEAQFEEKYEFASIDLQKQRNVLLLMCSSCGRRVVCDVREVSQIDGLWV